ncbi:MAG: hypothetical protein GX640_24305 [Fibrobacter sp.]|nr:hypothetical protein [Fibrobacter sp.]
MKLFKHCVLLFSLFLFLSCREEKSSTSNTSEKHQSRQQIKIDYPSLLDTLLVIQNEIMHAPDNKGLQQKLLLSAFDSISGSFLAAGTGISPIDQKPVIAEQLRLRTAKMVAQRWALYLKAWRSGNSVQFGDSISGTITYNTEVYSKMRNDTLYLIVQIPVGSIGM